MRAFRQVTRARSTDSSFAQALPLAEGGWFPQEPARFVAIARAIGTTSSQSAGNSPAQNVIPRGASLGRWPSCLVGRVRGDPGQQV